MEKTLIAVTVTIHEAVLIEDALRMAYLYDPPRRDEYNLLAARFAEVADEDEDLYA